MRKNLPVTQKVYAYPKERSLISVTDTKGRITYCNTDFMAVSGYDESELLGQPHNVLRHPDMPEEAFRDFWSTIEAGKIWSGLVKNRRKNGDTYWVHANATPMLSGDKVVGYLSVRTCPSAEEIAAAEELFAQMRADAEKNGKNLYLRLKGGALKTQGFLARFLRLFEPGIRARLLLPVLGAAAVPLVASALNAPWWLAAIAALLGAWLAFFWLFQTMMLPLTDAALVARRLASCDLSLPIELRGRGIVRRMLWPLSQLSLALRVVMRDIRGDLSDLSATAHTISERSQDLSRRTEDQAKSLAMASQEIHGINDAVSQMLNQADEGQEIAAATAAATARAQEAVGMVSEAMVGISADSERIAAIIQTIENVASQTNILALNAAVEAARAGEHGAGFAVVAGEVRALSQRTTAAAHEIRSIVESSRQRVGEGTARTDAARGRMDDVSGLVNEMRAKLQGINAASQTQTEAIAQIVTAIGQIDSLTEETAAMASDLAADAADLDRLSRLSSDNLRIFRINEHDKTHAETEAVGLRRKFKNA